MIKLKRKHDTYLAYQTPRLSFSAFSLTIFSLHRYYHLHHCGIILLFHMNPATLSIFLMILVHDTKSYRVIDVIIVFLHPIYKNSITFVYGMNNGLWSSRIRGDIYHNDSLRDVHNKNNHHVSIFDLFVALWFVNIIYCGMDDAQITYYVNSCFSFIFPKTSASN